VTGIVTSTFETVNARNAFARSSRRKSASMNSYIVNTQSPTIAIRARPGSERSRSSSEIGPASGKAIASPAVAVQNRDANPVATTRSGSSLRA
jgi:hypothetical protein